MSGHDSSCTCEHCLARELRFAEDREEKIIASVAKKDAALKACMAHFLRYVPYGVNARDAQEWDAVVAKVEEALRG